MDISANAMERGVGVNVTGGNTLVHLTTASVGVAATKVVRVDADLVETGHVVKVSADALVGDGATHTNLVYMKTASALVTAESKLISLRGTAMRNGAMVFVEASKMATGRNLHLQAGAR